MKKDKKIKYDFVIDSQDQKIIKELRDKHSVNISNFLRTSLRELYEKLSKK